MISNRQLKFLRCKEKLFLQTVHLYSWRTLNIIMYWKFNNLYPKNEIRRINFYYKLKKCFVIKYFLDLFFGINYCLDFIKHTKVFIIYLGHKQKRQKQESCCCSRGRCLKPINSAEELLHLCTFKVLITSQLLRWLQFQCTSLDMF